MHADERDYLSESLRERLEAVSGEESLLVRVLAMTKGSDGLEALARRLMAEARMKRAEEQG